ncbi:kinesin-like protein KIN-5A [Musa acuminata AAA Group]|uniref:kinesin-like protein KIN-5A n=1 Tax=Musa acuminata AAA Group TaxID=214697 RepID=UPI0031D43F4D
MSHRRRYSGGEEMDGSRKKGRYVAVSPTRSPGSTDKYGRGLLVDGNGNSSSNNSSSKLNKDKGVNIQVILRCRPLSDDEKRMNTPVVIFCDEHRREVTAAHSTSNKQIDRTFTFDKVFGPTSMQKDLFDQAIVPIVNEVLEGYNCTIFAYGQTGTGKTYSMEGGGRKLKNGELPSDAGVIPRAVQRIFHTLEAQSAEYSMKVTFLELYNEEITDLLVPDESKFSDDKTKKSIALMEDGKGGIFMRGLEEEAVYTAGEIYKILDKGSAKRHTAETLLNKQSSRSHSIFSITVHIKECTPEGEEMIKCGKLNLVDLAGSENISRSGARDGRAREAGEINKSLLTLGRVINTLVDHSGHIPYRDSKLTRLLRDSLGGRTKTCIIANISPSALCLDETLSTLDYAHRAKNIKNKPEVNQKMMKSAMIKELYTEIDRLKQEVFAAREKNGIYIPLNRFLIEEAEKKAMAEKIEKMELYLDLKDKQLVALQDLYNCQKLLSADLSDKLERTQKKLVDAEHALLDLEERYRKANSTIKFKEFLISALLKSEKALVEHAYELRSELENVAAYVSSLFSKIEHKGKIEEENRKLVQKFRSQLTQELDHLHRIVSASLMRQETQLKEMEEDMESFIPTKAKATEEIRMHVERLKAKCGSGIRDLDALAGELDKNSEYTFGRLNSQVLKHSTALENCFKGIASEADQHLNELQVGLSKQEDKLAAFAQQQHEGHLRAIESMRSISKITSSLFETLDIHASKLSKILGESLTIQYQQLHDVEKKFEECVVNEERQLLEEVAAMLASSSARKKKLVQTAVDSLRASAVDRTSNLQKEMSTASDFTRRIKGQWKAYMEETENHYIEDTAAVESSRNDIEEGLKSCMAKARMGTQQWRNAQNSLLILGKGNEASADSIVRNGLDANQHLRAKLSSAVSSTLEDVNTSNKDILSCIDSSLKLDQDACANLDSVLVPCHGELRELKNGHYHKIVEITDIAEKCLEEEYTVDGPSCSTPKKRSISLPSIASIEELRTPDFEELLKSYRDSMSASKQANGDAKHLSVFVETNLMTGEKRQETSSDGPEYLRKRRHVTREEDEERIPDVVGPEYLQTYLL